MKEIRVLTEAERNWSMLCHMSAFLGFVFPFGGIIGPLVCWMSKRDESLWLNENGKSALNFNLSVLLYMVLISPLVLIVVGIPLIGMLVLFRIIFIIIASVKASKGEEFRYPLSIPFIQ